MKIAIIGADGQLGSDLCKVIPKYRQIPLTISDIDISNNVSCNTVLAKFNPDVVINTAGYSKVDDCEENDKEAYKINSHGAKNLALACAAIGAKLAHISSDYVFDGDNEIPYTENDMPNPKTAYGISKLAGEQFIKYLWPKHFIVRTSGLFGAAGCLGKGGGNFVENIIKRAKAGEKLKIVTDEIISPTYTLDLAKKICGIISTDHFNLYHITNNGQCSWYDYTVKILELLNIKATIEPITAEELKTKAHRPRFSVLDNYNLRKIGLDDLPGWETALRDYLVEKGHLNP